MKRLAIFPSQVSTAGTNIYADFSRSTGWQLEENSLDADAAVIWSILWQGRMTKNQHVYDRYRKQNKPVIIIETGVIKRNQTFKVCVNETDRYVYVKYGTTNDNPLGVSAADTVKKFLFNKVTGKYTGTNETLDAVTFSAEEMKFNKDLNLPL